MCKYNIIVKTTFSLSSRMRQYDTRQLRGMPMRITYREMYFFATCLRHSVNCWYFLPGSKLFIGYRDVSVCEVEILRQVKISILSTKIREEWYTDNTVNRFLPFRLFMSTMPSQLVGNVASGRKTKCDKHTKEKRK